MPEIPIEIEGVEKLEKNLNAVQESIDKTAASAGRLGEDFKRAIAGTVLIRSLSQVSEAFDGAAQAGIKAAAGLASAFMQGGPTGLAISAVSMLVTEGISTWKAYEEAATQGARATAEQQQRTTKVIEDQVEALAKLNTEMRGIRRAREEGLGIGEAIGLVTREEAEASVRNQETMIETSEQHIRRLNAELAKLAVDPTRKAERDREELERQRDMFRNTIVVAEAGKKEGAALIAKLDAEFLRDEEKRIAESEEKKREVRTKAIEERISDEDHAYVAGVNARAAVRARDLAQFELDLDIEAEAGFRARQRKEEDEREVDERSKQRHDFAFEERTKAAGWAAAKLVQIEKSAADEKLLVWADEAQQREAINATWVAAGADVARSVVDLLVAGEGEVTKAALESKAKQAGIEALFQVAQGLAATAEFAASFGLAAPLAGAAAAHFAAAAKFAAIGAIAGVASLGAASGGGAGATGGGGSFAAPQAFRATGGGRDDSRGYGGSVRSGSGNTYVFQGGVLLTQADAAKAVRKANAESERTR